MVGTVASGWQCQSLCSWPEGEGKGSGPAPPLLASRPPSLLPASWGWGPNRNLFWAPCGGGCGGGVACPSRQTARPGPGPAEITDWQYRNSARVLKDYLGHSPMPHRWGNQGREQGMGLPGPPFALTVRIQFARLQSLHSFAFRPCSFRKP